MTIQRRASLGSAGGGGGGVSSLHAIAPNYDDNVSQQWPEEDIRRSLNGTFTRMDWRKSRAVTVFVPEDHIPRHLEMHEPRVEGEKWEPDDDAQLLELMRQGVRRKQDLAEELGRTECSVHARLRRLRRARHI